MLFPLLSSCVESVYHSAMNVSLIWVWQLLKVCLLCGYSKSYQCVCVCVCCGSSCSLERGWAHVLQLDTLLVLPQPSLMYCSRCVNSGFICVSEWLHILCSNLLCWFAVWKYSVLQVWCYRILNIFQLITFRNEYSNVLGDGWYTHTHTVNVVSKASFSHI